MLFKPKKENFEDMTKDDLIEKVKGLREEIGSSRFGKSEHKWFSLIENAPNMIVVIDRDHKIQFINHPVPGFSKEEVVGTEVYRYTAPGYHSVAESIINHVFKTGEVSSYEYEGAGPYDEHAWYEAQVGPVKSDGEIVAVTLFITDITLRKSVEEALIKSEEQYRILVEGANQPIFKVRKDGAFIFLNTNAAEQIGGKPEDYIGKTMYDLFPKEIADGHLSSIRKAIDSGERLVVKEAESMIQGEVRWFEASIQPLENDEGKIDSALVIVTDISERRKAEIEIRKEKDFTNKVINALEYPLYVIDLDYKVVLSNESAKNRGIVEGGRCYEMTHGKNSPCEDCECPLKKVLEEKKSVQIEHVHCGKDGKEAITEVHADPVLDDNGNVIQMIEYAIDVTKRKETQDELRKLSYTVKQSPNIVMMTDDKGIIEYVNAKFCDITGLNSEEAIGHRPSDFAEKSKDYEKREKEIMETTSQGKEWHGIFKNLKKNGGTYWESAAIFPLRDQDGNITNYVKIGEDVTDRIKVEEALKESEEGFRAMFESAVDGMLLADSETKKFTNANNKLCEMLGYSFDEITNMGVEDIHPKEDLSYVFGKFERQRKGEITLADNMPVLRKDGSIFYADINSSPVSLRGKTYLLGAFRDITERREMEEKLRESEVKYRTIFENSGTPMALIRSDLSIIMMNDEFAKLAGHTKESMKGKDILQFVHPEDLEKVKEYHRLRGIDPNSVPNRYELRLVDEHNNVKEGYIIVAAIPETDIMVVAFADVTEIKRSEQKLKEQKDILDNVNKALEHKVKELEEAIGHIKRLEGLVPICASCKKIKVEGKDGQDDWMQLENYISQKTDASLTHGLCPECIKKLYGKTKE